MNENTVRNKVRQQTNTERVFLELLKAGLWEKEVRLHQYGDIDFAGIYKLAEEQSVVGMVAAGIEQMGDIIAPQEWALQFIGTTLQLEQRNKEMNSFIGLLIKRMREEGIYTTIVKGQGIAQCYERPLWRASGDVDLYLSEENYQKAKVFLRRYGKCEEEEDVQRRHLAMKIDSFMVELHGTMHTSLSRKICFVLDQVHTDVFGNGAVRCWQNGDVDVFLPNIDNDVVIVFTHFITHFYIGGLGLRQVCDWCRLLWKYRTKINLVLLNERIANMGLMEEWKAFASLAVDYLGMSEEAIPFYNSKKCYSKKAKRIMRLVMEAGNFGHNKDLSLHAKLPKAMRPIETFLRRFFEFSRLATIFPKNAPKFFFNYVGGHVR